MENPIEVIDRTLSTYTGGSTTDEYYAKVYANQQNGVPTETLVIEQTSNNRSPASSQILNSSQQQSQYNQQYQYSPQNQQVDAGYAQGQTVDWQSQAGQGESPIDFFLRTTVTDGSAQTNHVQQTGVAQQQETALPPAFTTSVAPEKKVDISPTGIFGFMVSAAFSFAVVVSVIGLMFIVYIIIRTRQLHHHEHHVKELGGHGGGHSAPATHATHDVHAASAHAKPHEEEHTDHSEDQDVDVEEKITDGETYEANENFARSEGNVDRYSSGVDVSRKVVSEDVVPVDADAEEVLSPVAPTARLTSSEAAQYSARLKTIKADAASEDEDAWYTALMDVNLLLEDVLGEKGYEGTSVKEMLASESAQSLATRDVALEAEAEFQKLISGEKQLSQDAIVALVNMYAKVCKELGVV